MTREDLKNYKYNQEWIKGRLEYIEEYRTNITNITTTLSDMPKRKQKSRRQHCRKDSKIIRYNKWFTKQNNRSR